MIKRALLMKDTDNVATVLDYVYSGDLVKVELDGLTYCEIKAADEIDCYHKIAIKEISKGERVLKYGEVIGQATQQIELGRHVHVNNIESVMVI